MGELSLSLLSNFKQRLPLVKRSKNDSLETGAADQIPTDVSGVPKQHSHLHEHWEVESYTDPGKKRAVNEDSVFCNKEELLWGVADGMGGHDDGAYASQHVACELEKFTRKGTRGESMRRIVDTLRQCNQHLINKASDTQGGIIGCTAALMTVNATDIICSWSGDSRVYRIREKQLNLLTEDHNFLRLVNDRDVNCPAETFSGNPEMLTAAIGGESETHIEHCCFPLCDGDKFLICTDGLYKEVSDIEIQRILNQTCTARSYLEQLSTLYLDRGARDNIGMICAIYRKH